MGMSNKRGRSKSFYKNLPIFVLGVTLGFCFQIGAFAATGYVLQTIPDQRYVDGLSGEVIVEAKSVSGVDLPSGIDDIHPYYISYRADNLPVGATFRPMYRHPGSPYKFTWTPTAQQRGVHTVTFRLIYRTGGGEVTLDAQHVDLTVAVNDGDAPSGTVTINNGDQYTSSKRVTLTLSATDATSTVDKMRFAKTATAPSPKNESHWWPKEDYRTTKSIVLGAAGLQTVYVQFFDRAGNGSAVASDSIRVDTTDSNNPPTIEGIIPSNTTVYTQGDTVTIEVTASDLDGHALLYRFFVDGEQVRDWDAATTFDWDSSQKGSGPHTVMVEVKDPFVIKSKSVEVCGYRRPIGPPPEVVTIRADYTPPLGRSRAAAPASVPSKVASGPSQNSGLFTTLKNGIVGSIKEGLSQGVSVPDQEPRQPAVTAALQPPVAPGVQSSAPVVSQGVSLPEGLSVPAQQVPSSRKRTFRGVVFNLPSVTNGEQEAKSVEPEGQQTPLLIANRSQVYTNNANQLIGGVKEPQELVWVNQHRVIDPQESIQWYHMLKLKEGKNDVAVLVKDPVADTRKEISAAIVLDTREPEGRIQKIKPLANNVLSLRLFARDPGTKMEQAQMQFSQDGVTWSDPEAYRRKKEIALASEGGPLKTIYVRFKDAAGNWSEPVSKSFMYIGQESQ